MKGIVTKINKSASKIFFITGDDGVEYFGHLNELANKKQWSHYFYKGSKCTFDVLDEGKSHLKAVNIESIDVYDPLAEERKIRAEKAIENKIKKEKAREERRAVEEGRMSISEMTEPDPNFVKHINEMKRHDRNQKWSDYVKEHTRYVIQKRVESGWVNVKPLEIFDKPEVAKEMVSYYKAKSKDRYRIKKYMVHIIGGKYILKDFEN